MRTAFLAIVLLASFSLPLASLPSRTHDSSLPQSLAARFLAAAPETLLSYRATRRLEAHNTRFNRSGWLEAETTLDDGVFSYRIVAQGGSNMVVERALVPALEGERDALRTAAQAALTAANYDFNDDGIVNEWGRIRLVPKRKDRLLVDGWIFVSPATVDLVEIQGQLVKSPSFWVRRVGIVRRYARIAGARVPVSTESTASVRFAGDSTFSMRYAYETINGVAVDGGGVR